MMTLCQIARLGKELAKFLALFAGCFRSQPGFALGGVYVQGLLSNLGRKNVEAIALEFDTPPRTLQRLLESIKWDGPGVRGKCQQLVARDCIAKGSWESACVRTPAVRVDYGHRARRRFYDAEAI